MTATALSEVIKKTWWICAGEVCLMGAIVLLNETRFGALAFVLSCANAAGFYFHVFKDGFTSRVTTLRRYFNSLCHSLIALSIAVGIVVAVLLAEHRGFSAESVSWITISLCAVAAHQAWRGAAGVMRRWKSAEDVRQSVATARRADHTAKFSRKYDLGFFVAVSLVASLISRAFGQPISLFIGATLLALSLPYAVGVAIACIALVKQFFPIDEELPTEE